MVVPVFANYEPPLAAAECHAEVEARPLVVTHRCWRPFRDRPRIWQHCIGLIGLERLAMMRQSGYESHGCFSVLLILSHLLLQQKSTLSWKQGP